MTKKNFNLFAIVALALFVGIVAYFSWYKSPCCSGSCTAQHAEESLKQAIDVAGEQPLEGNEQE